jgi:hypothetical protein
MRIELHDGTPAGPGEPHGPAGPTHCGTAHVEVDYEYQFEMWMDSVHEEHPDAVRLVAPELGREWVRDSTGRFVEKTPTSPTA